MERVTIGWRMPVLISVADFPLHRRRGESAGAGDFGVKEAVAGWDRLPTMWIVEPLPEWRRPADADSTLPEWPDLLP